MGFRAGAPHFDHAPATLYHRKSVEVPPTPKRHGPESKDAAAQLWLLGLSLLVGGPQRQVVPQQLHDERRVLVGVFGHIVQLSNGILERCACHLAGLFWLVPHLVLEHGVV